MAISQLKVDTDIVRSVLLVLLAGFYPRKPLRVGEPIEIGEQRGTLDYVTR